MTLNLMEYKRNNWTLIICVVAVVLVIIFIPDFLGLDSFFDDNSNQEVTETAVKDGQENKPEKVEQVKQVKQEVVPTTTNVSSPNKQNDNLAYFSSLVDSGAITQDNQQVNVPQLTWEQLKSPNYQQILLNAKQVASRLAASINPSYDSSKYALYNFVTGVDFVLRDASTKMSVNDAMSYLEYLDMEVTRSFVKDGLEREYFTTWEAVSLTKLVGSNRAERFKKMSKPRFHPEVTLGTVEIKVAKANQKRARQDVYDASKMDINFTIKPDDAVRCEIYRDAQKIRDLNFSNGQGGGCIPGTTCKGGSQQTRTKTANIDLKGLAVDGIYTVRLYDRDNKIFDKQYSFTKAFRLPNWRMPANSNQIVFSMPATLDYSRAEGVFVLRNDYEDGFITGGDDVGFSTY